MPAPPSPQTRLVSTAPNVSTKSDKVQEKAVEEVSNLTEIGCRAGRRPPVHKLLETTDRQLCQIQLKSTPISTFSSISTRTVSSRKGGLTPLGVNFIGSVHTASAAIQKSLAKISFWGQQTVPVAQKNELHFMAQEPLK